MDLADLRCEHFAACLAQPFLLTHAGGVFELTLEQAIPAANATCLPGGRAPFSIQFRGPRQTLLPQGVYRLENPQLGVHEIFIVPIRADAQWVDYQAVFG